jgi:hypothetical protein
MTYSEFAAEFPNAEVQPSGYILATREQAAQLAEVKPSDLRELGTSMPTRYSYFERQDYNPELVGREGLMKYDKMRRNDGQVRMSLRYLKTPVLAGRWYMEPFDEKKRSQTISDFMWKNIMKDMTASWPQFLLESLGMLDFGFYLFEKVRTLDKNGKVVFRKFAPKHPLDLWEWEYDSHGGPLTAWFYGPKGVPGSVDIPVEKLLCFTYDKEGGDMLGMSALRPAYKHHFFKDTLYRIDAIQKERHGIGIPLIRLPAIFSPADKLLANEIGANLRTNERTHVVLPPMWDLEFIKLEGQPVDAMLSIEHHDKMIARNVMLEVAGDRKDDDKLFLKNASFVAELFRDVLNKWAIPEIVQWNWGIEEYPELKVRGIGNTIDWRALSFALRNMIGAGIIEPDDALEKFIRDEMDLPRKDPNSVRKQEQKQMPGSGAPFNQNGGGKPKQSTAGGMEVNTGSSKVGRDGGSPK